MKPAVAITLIIIGGIIVALPPLQDAWFAFMTTRLLEHGATYRPNPAAIANLATITTSLERLVAEESGEMVGTVRYGVFDGSLRVIGYEPQ